jgi:hypothetical protein
VRAQNLNEGDSVVSVNKILNPDESDAVKSVVPDARASSQDNEVQQTSLLTQESPATEE